MLIDQYLLQRCYLTATATENIYEKNQVEKTDWGNRGWFWSLSASSIRRALHFSQSVSGATHGKPVWFEQREAGTAEGVMQFRE